MSRVTLVVHNLRSAHNVGSILRTADGAGVERVYCVGTTPTPVDRFGRKRQDIAKVALGAETSVSWEYRAELVPLLGELKTEGYRLVALEQDERAVDYGSLALEARMALIVGPEVGGLDKDVLDLVDVVVEIPMHGSKESLNVSVAAGIALFALRTS